MKLNERLGVPEGIEIEAYKLKRTVLANIQNLKLPDEIKNGAQYTIEIGKVDVVIKDLSARNIPITLTLVADSGIKEPLLISLGYGNKFGYSVSNNIIKIKENIKESMFLVNIAIPVNITANEFIDAFNKKIKTSDLAHELKHLYDAYKGNRVRGLLQQAEYKAYSMFALPDKLSEFLHLLYYTTMAENSVRPVEMYQELLDHDVTKENFLEYMNDSKMIKYIERARKFTFEEFKKELNADPEIVEFIKRGEKAGYERIGDIATDALNIMFVNITNNTMIVSRTLIHNFIQTSSKPFFIRIIMGDESDEKIKKIAIDNLNRIANIYINYQNNPEKYFAKLEKNLNFVGEKMKRKLFKLYDMVKDSNKIAASKTSECIVNWDLYVKLYGSEPTFNLIDFTKKPKSK